MAVTSRTTERRAQPARCAYQPSAPVLPPETRRFSLISSGRAGNEMTTTHDFAVHFGMSTSARHTHRERAIALCAG